MKPYKKTAFILMIVLSVLNLLSDLVLGKGGGVPGAVMSFFYICLFYHLASNKPHMGFMKMWMILAGYSIVQFFLFIDSSLLNPESVSVAVGAVLFVTACHTGVLRFLFKEVREKALIIKQY